MAVHGTRLIVWHLATDATVWKHDPDHHFPDPVRLVGLTWSAVSRDPARLPDATRRVGTAGATGTAPPGYCTGRYGTSRQGFQAGTIRIGVSPRQAGTANGGQSLTAER